MTNPVGIGIGAGVNFKLNPAIERALTPSLEKMLVKLTKEVELEAKRDAPVRGGHRSFAPGGPVGGNLRRSITSAVKGAGTKIIGIVKATAPYAAYVEFGTYKMEARPYLRSALMRVIKHVRTTE